MFYLTVFGGAFIAWLILVTLFTPAIPYHLEADVDSGSDHFIHLLESVCQTTLEQGNRIEIFANGTTFGPPGSVQVKVTAWVGWKPAWSR